MKESGTFYEGICQLRLVFDTNVIISAMLSEGSKPSKAFDIGIKHGVILFSSPIFAELVPERKPIKSDITETYSHIANLRLSI